MSFTLFGKMLAFSCLEIRSNGAGELDSGALEQFLQSKAQVGQVPVVIDSDCDLDLSKLIELLWEHRIAVIGVASGVLNDQAEALRLAIFPSGGTKIARLHNHLSPSSKPDQQDLSSEQGDSTMVAEPVATTDGFAPVKDLVYQPLVRSGQSVHHMGGDLIVLGSVNHGAEVASECNLHIYGKAQGRLVAGATGDETARIFCQIFDPILVSVAGAYSLKDDIPSDVIGKAVMVSYSHSDHKLNYTVMG